MTTYEAVIGLEVHAQLLTRTKLFCGCSAEYGAEPNTHVCPVCLGLPGALPVPNEKAIELAIRAGLALGCKVRTTSRFARKNYFYPDLSKNYQTSQYDEPIDEHGELVIEVDGVEKRIGITRAHLEEDAAKNVHGEGGGLHTVVDYNRAGTPLLEIVSEPDLRSAAEAEAYLKKLRDILMFIGVNDGNLEEGSFRCDANVSIRPVGQEEFGTRTELKNINSFKFVRKAIEYEIARQEAVVSSGGKIVQETRTWNEAQQKTVTMRSKEEAHDYRYFPCPDLPPIRVSEERIESIRASLPELPDAKRARYVEQLGLTPYDAGVLTGHPEIARFFEATLAALGDEKLGKKVANFIQSEVLRFVETRGLEATFPVKAEALAGLLALVEKGSINGKIAKQVFAEMVETGASAESIVESKGLAAVTDTAALEAEIQKVLDANPAQVEQYRGGKQAVFGFFVGQVMKATKGQADPKAVQEILRRLLG
ncbi:MAG: Asp-tRNA(Asn)/Glu-tRNA(Gln) amidotransferase subunit GatB [Myxococcales bacterium]|jgi:aspartyl-tRNA(Asn)/glutamyl-tRNA(Gln) amidotransferase subunit B|nr:Asp-tRNA(Asn)/Glu-tRNA(Gln) amidotransferase subunit GatB [Myxococcales bacterium]